MDWKGIFFGPPKLNIVLLGVLIGAAIIFVVIGLNR